MKKAIISVLGKDRPGIIAAVTKILFDQSCNIENVSQTILQSEFSGIFIIALPEKVSPGELSTSLKKGLEGSGLHIFVKDIEPLSEKPIVRSEPFVVTTQGPDRKGLVANITAILAADNVNVTGLQAVFKGGADPENNIMIYQVDIPEHIDIQSLTKKLRKKAEELNLDISIQHRRIFEAINRI